MVQDVKPIQWSDDFSVGIRSIDDQHKRLVKLVNRMLQNPAAETGSETVSDVLSQMTRYAKTHFKFEEDLMLKNAFPHIDAHKKAA